MLRVLGLAVKPIVTCALAQLVGRALLLLQLFFLSQDAFILLPPLLFLHPLLQRASPRSACMGPFLEGWEGETSRKHRVNLGEDSTLTENFFIL